MSRFVVLTVCTGNVHRSPLAAALLRQWAAWYLPPDLASAIIVTSAGTGPPVGAPMGQTAAVICRALGADDTTHRARQLDDDTIATADLVLAASRSHRDEILSRVPSAMRRTFTFREAARAARAHTGARPALGSVNDLRHTVGLLAEHRAPPTHADDDDVIDPHKQGAEAYLRMAEEEVPALCELAEVLFGMPHADLEEYRRVSSDAAFLGIAGPSLEGQR